MNTKSHWDQVFKKTESHQLGWFDKEHLELLRYLKQLELRPASRLFLAGIGTSSLVKTILPFNYRLVLNDISATALTQLQRQLNDCPTEHPIQWLCQDVSEPLPKTLKPIDCWIDRAALHFLTDEDAIKGYFSNLKKALKPQGYALFAEFSKEGAKQCAGLTVKPYDIDDFQRQLVGFNLISTDNFTFIGPNGQIRPYIIALFQKQAE